MPREESIARKILPATAGQEPPKTAKQLVRLPAPIASRLIEASRQAWRSILESAPADRPTMARDTERALMEELAYVWDNRLSEAVLPNKYTLSSERIVLETLEFVRQGRWESSLSRIS